MSWGKDMPLISADRVWHGSRPVQYLLPQSTSQGILFHDMIDHQETIVHLLSGNHAVGVLNTWTKQSRKL